MTVFTLLPSPGVSGVEMKIYERSLQSLLSSAPRARVLARLALLAQVGELARGLHKCNLGPGSALWDTALADIFPI